MFAPQKHFPLNDFSFSKLAEKVGARVKEWLHPSRRVRFWLKKNKETEQKSNPKLRRGDKGLILPSPQC